MTKKRYGAFLFLFQLINLPARLRTNITSAVLTLFFCHMLPSWVLPYPSFICPLFPADLWILVCKGVEISEVSEPIVYFLLFLFSSLSFFRACPVLGKHQNLVPFSPASSSFSSSFNIETYEHSMSVNGIMWWDTTSKLSARMNQTLNYENPWVCKAHTNEQMLDRLRCTCSYKERQSPSNSGLKLCSKWK